MLWLRQRNDLKPAWIRPHHVVVLALRVLDEPGSAKECGSLSSNPSCNFSLLPEAKLFDGCLGRSCQSACNSGKDVLRNA